jgi:hypothetical protein
MMAPGYNKKRCHGSIYYAATSVLADANREPFSINASKSGMKLAIITRNKE